MTMPLPGTVIILNGTSSSGKTTLLNQLQREFEPPFLNVGIDKFIWMLPVRFLDRPLWDEVLGKAIESGDLGHRLFGGMHHSIAVMSRLGNHVVADHVLVERRWAQECAQLLAELPAYLIGVRCPLEVTEQRERERGDRTLGQARIQFERVHAFAQYDFEVDTSVDDPATCAAKVKAYVESNAPAGFQRMRDALR